MTKNKIEVVVNEELIEKVLEHEGYQLGMRVGFKLGVGTSIATIVLLWAMWALAT